MYMFCRKAIPPYLSSLCPRISFNRWFYSGLAIKRDGTWSVVTCMIPRFSSKAVPHSSLAASPIPLVSRKSRFGLANCGTVPRLLRRTKPPSRIYNEATPRRLPSRATRLAIAGRYSCKKPLKATKQSSAVPQFLSSLCPRISL